MHDNWVDAEALAKHLSVSKETIYRWVEKGDFPVHRLGRLFRFKLKEVDRWVLNRSSFIPNNLRIMVVDDDDVELQIVERALKKFTIEKINSGAEALNQMQSLHYDLMITDLKMPEMDGLELMAAALKINPSLVVIVLTGMHDKDIAMCAWKLGAFDYLDKSMMPGNIDNAVSRACDFIRIDMENKKLIADLYQKNEELHSRLESSSL
jgi:excisionase family DNA binding protein